MDSGVILDCGSLHGHRREKEPWTSTKPSHRSALVLNMTPSISLGLVPPWSWEAAQESWICMVPVGHIPWTLTWSQVVAQTLGINRVLCVNRSHRHQYRPHCCSRVIDLVSDPRQQLRPRHCHGLGWQIGHLPYRAPHCPCLFRSATLSRA